MPSRYLTDSKDSHLIVTVSSKERAAVSRPCQGQALWVCRVLAHTNKFGLELIDNRLALQVEDW